MYLLRHQLYITAQVQHSDSDNSGPCLHVGNAAYKFHQGQGDNTGAQFGVVTLQMQVPNQKHKCSIAKYFPNKSHISFRSGLNTS